MSKIIKISDRLLIFIESHRKFKQESYSGIIERELELDDDFIETLKKFQILNIPITDNDENTRLMKRRKRILGQYNRKKFKCKICNNDWKRKVEKFPVVCRFCQKHNWFVGDNYPCEICNKIVLTPEIHHIDKNRNNNVPNNLLVSCTRCHKRIHGQKVRNFHGLDIETKKRITYYYNKISNKI